MLAIRLQRTGRTGHAQFRVIVQDSHRSPKSGKVVAQLGSYNPHTKQVVLDKEKAAYYLSNGAQPSDRVVSILKAEGVKLPKWLEVTAKKEGKIRNPEKLRKNQPDTPTEETAASETEMVEGEEQKVEETKSEEASTEEPAQEEVAADDKTEEAAEKPEEKPAE